MAWCPFAVTKPLHPENESEPRIVPLQMILHTAVSTASSLWGYFGRSDVNTESHFYVAQDGTVEQYMDTTRQADAQFDGNLHGISVETWDGGDPDHTPLTDQQVRSYVRLAQWLNSTHGIPLTACSGPQNPGQGYHSMFPQWAKDGHTCPNALRIAQWRNEILPALQGQPQELDLTDEEHVQLNNIRADVGSLHTKVDQVTQRVDAVTVLLSGLANNVPQVVLNQVAAVLADPKTGVNVRLAQIENQLAELQARPAAGELKVEGTFKSVE